MRYFEREENGSEGKAIGVEVALSQALISRGKKRNAGWQNTGGEEKLTFSLPLGFTFPPLFVL